MKHIPQRKCLGCNQSFDKDKLIRIVKTTEGNLIIDSEQKANGSGKGGYLCHDSKCLKMAVKKRAFSRLFKTELIDELIDKLDNEINENE